MIEPLRCPIRADRAAVFVVLVGVCTTISGCGRVGAGEEPSASPRVQASPVSTEGGRIELDHAFGLVRPGAELRHMFRVRNETVRRWIVASIDPGCSCTSVGLERREVAPGGELLADVTFDAGTEAGDRSAGVRIRLGGPDDPEIFLSMTANVRGELTCHPKEVSLTDRKPAAVLHAFNYGDTPWEALVATSSVGWLSAECELTDEVEGVPAGGLIPRQSWRVRVAVKDGVRPEPGAAALRLKVPGRTPAADVVVQYRVEPGMRAAPEQVFFGECRPGEEVTKKVLFVFREDAGASGPGGLKVEQSPGVALRHRWAEAGDHRWNLVLTLAAGERVGPVSGEVTVRGTGEDEVRISYSALVRQP